MVESSSASPSSLRAEAAEVIAFPSSAAEHDLEEFEERDRAQQISRSLWAQRVSDLWGTEPPYEEQPEDRSGWLLGTLFYQWIGQYIREASREQLTESGLPKPTRQYRAYNAGVVLAAELQRQQARRHAWDGYVGARVGVRWDDASDGVLRWVGAVQQYGTPGRLYAGVEWRVAPSRRRGCCVGRCVGWLLRRGRSAPVPERGPGAYHRGEVDGEHLFDPVEDDTVLTCERVEDVVFRPGFRGDASQVSSTRALLKELPASAQQCPCAIQVWWAVWTLFRQSMLHVVVLGIIRSGCQLMTPLLLKWFVTYLGGVGEHKDRGEAGLTATITSPVPSLDFSFASVQRSSGADSLDSGWQRGVWLAALMFVTMVGETLAGNKQYHVRRRSSLQVRNALSAALFAKVFTMSPKATHHPAFNAGRLTNLMSTDVEVMGRFIMMFWTLASTPFMLAIVFYQLYVLLGVSVCVGGVVALVFMPLQTYIVRKMSSSYRSKAQATDHRVKATTEFFSGIRVAKFMSWEPFFISRIEKLRRVELSHLEKLQRAIMMVFFQFNATPGLVIASVFFTFSVAGHTLTPTIVFPAIALFNLLMGLASMLPFALQLMTKLFVSLRRLNMFFDADDELESVVEDIALAASRTMHTDVSRATGTDDAQQQTPSSALADDVAAEFVHADLSTYVAQELTKTEGAPEANSAGHVAVDRSPVPETDASLPDRQPSPSPAVPAPADPVTQPLSSSAQKGIAEITFNEDSIYVLKTKTLVTDVDLRVPRGRLTVVLGPTGSGKSTLLDALIGALAVTRGRVACSRSVAYVPQQPWIMNATLRDNVVFFGAPDAAAFERAVRSTQLASDLALLADGAGTEIGERGINLSGGQKARVGLARAVYADRDVYVLDDPLSALDAQVGERVMRECVCGALASKTRVLATHQVGAAAYADYVVVLTADGRVAFQGSSEAYCKDHLARQVSERGAAASEGTAGAAEDEPPVASITAEKRLSDLMREEPPAADTTLTDVSEAEGHASEDKGKLLTEEERFRGAVGWDVYVRYMKACGGVSVCASIVALYLATEVVMMSTSIWLALWSTKWLPLSATQYSFIYVGLSFASALTTPLRYWLSMSVMRRASRKVHQDLLRSVACATLQFFDTTPLGRIVNRFTNDMGNIDSDLQGSYSYLLSTVSTFFSTVAMMVATQIFVLGILIPCMVAYYYLLKFYARANREIKRLVNRVNSPMLSVLQEAVGGRWTVQAYGAAPAVIQKAIRCADVVYTCSYLQLGAELWLSVRIQLLSTSITLAVALGAVAAMHLSFLPSHIGLLSLSLTLALEISSLLDGIVTVLASVEADMNSIERVFYMTDHIEHEDLQEAVAAEVRRINEDAHGTERRDAGALAECEEPAGLDNSSSPLLIRQSGNTQFGSLVLEHVDMRYRLGLPLVLRDVCFAVAPGQKVGVVGRTGSGKSTLLLAFLRLVEVCGGRMLVCGRDARDYGVRELRGLFSMIPQDPLLFDGTVRSNVDPFGRCGDAGVWRALRQVGMEERVRGDAGGLDGRVQEGGANYSVGQRQLLCLARALLKRGSAFLLMDEATANVDPALDRQIQRTVQHTFRDYTVVTIAHRLHTVAACDVIVVMDQGRVLEFGSPRELVERQGSAFSALVGSLGSDGEQLFRMMMRGSLAE
ncbi:p-glycoprotein e [Leishmania mexicana MHOM/GT/2001/U1103]|uniref:p-glycoprotein e n=1 Tax=Leishmania mexicana (strain MHOM/GT/2001/U1103) TaxID=929439 RepID=E9B1S5_LEIMU|nr:p-glycoprotein e [Leishmania mexicana MHOM/GT/2001/U1103]CBZ29182.1 p-glycoprotein e [Leishmania mexicana MHOM/GT/2001/U1103]